MSPLAETPPEHWTYIAEGGSTIVFSYSGPRNLHFDGTVIRLRKCPVSQQEGAQVVEEADDPTVDFQKNVIQRVVPGEFLPHLEHVDVEREWLERMVAAHESVRPLKRRQKDQIDLTRTKAVLATDLIGNNGWAIEIKPKWGFLPFPLHLSENSKPIKTRICRFCMKKNTGKDAFHSSYCPLDLYSESEERVRTALHALWDDWYGSHGTVNNLRIFVDGKVLDPTSDTCAQSLSQKINNGEGTFLELREKFVSIILPVLLSHPVLSTLSKLQRSLDPLDIEGLSKLCADSPISDYPHSPLPLPTAGLLVSDPTLSEWSSFLDDVKSSHNELDHANPDKAKQRHYILAYLLSATFKDCSIIVRPHGDNAASAAVTIIDLDAKSLQRLPRWEALDREVVSASGSDTRACADGQTMT